MKLSKQRLNKIKVRKEGSRKKKHLRKNKKKFDNSKKKHNRKSHLKNKTLKIYFGGGPTDGCEYRNIPVSNKLPDYFTKLSLDKKKDYINTYFDPNKNNICLQEARDQLLTYLKVYYRTSDPKPEDSVLVELKDLWESKLDPVNLPKEQECH